MKDIKHIKPDFHSVAYVMPQGWDFGVYRGVGGEKKNSLKFNPIWCVRYSYEWHVQRHNFLVPAPLWRWGGAKRSNIIKFQLPSQFQRFLNQTLGVLGCHKLNFLNMVMAHIELKGVISRPGYTVKFYPRIKLVTLGWGQRVKYH